jgi:beta-mannosidase
VLLAAVPDKASGDIRIMASSDVASPRKVEADISAVAMSGESRRLFRIDTEIGPAAAVQVGKVAGSELKPDEILYFTWDAGEGRQSSHFSPRPYKSYDLPTPQIRSDARAEEGRLHITLTAHALALYVTAECAVPGHFSDNAFDLLPDGSMSITFTPDDPVQLEAALSSLIFRDLHSATYARKV